MILKLGSVIYKKEEFYDSTEKVICSEALDDEIWNSKIDSNRRDTFFNLPQTMGCPECARGTEG